MGAARVVLDVDVQRGKQTAASHALPGLWRLSQFLSTLQATAEQLTSGQRWCRILSRVFHTLVGGVELKMPQWLGTMV